MRKLLKPSFLVLLSLSSIAVLVAACSSDDDVTPFPTVTQGSGEVPTPLPEPTERKQYEQPPALQIDPTKNYTATIVTEVGDIVLELFADRAPGTVNNFVFLSRDGYYDNITFHRVIAKFMAQGGDPTAIGTGGPGYTIQDEFHPDARHEAGVISMANTGMLHSGGAQFFITFVPTPNLDGLNPDGSPKPCGNPGVSCHAVFGRVIGGEDAVAAIRLRDPASDPNPGTRIETIQITEE